MKSKLVERLAEARAEIAALTGPTASAVAQSFGLTDDYLPGYLSTLRAQERYLLRQLSNLTPTLLVWTDCTQLGLKVEASVDGGQTWTFVQTTPYVERGGGVDPQQDTADYFAELDRKGVIYQRVQDRSALHA